MFWIYEVGSIWYNNTKLIVYEPSYLISSHDMKLGIIFLYIPYEVPIYSLVRTMEINIQPFLGNNTNFPTLRYTIKKGG